MINYLPIGTVVTLINGTKKIMIYGRKQFQTGYTKEWDYVACLYPEGNITEDYNIFFNHVEVETKYISELVAKGYAAQQTSKQSKL